MEILGQSSTAFVLTHNFQGTHILGASRGYLSDSVASCLSSENMFPWEKVDGLWATKSEDVGPLIVCAVCFHGFQRM